MGMIMVRDACKRLGECVQWSVGLRRQWPYIVYYGYYNAER